MYTRAICRLLGFYLGILSLVLLIPIGVSAYFDYFADPAKYPQPHATMGFAYTFLITVILAFACHFIGRSSTAQVYKRESILLVVAIWISCSSRDNKSTPVLHTSWTVDASDLWRYGFNSVDFLFVGDVGA